MTTTPTRTQALTCPAYCDLPPDHDWGEMPGGRIGRDHGGLRFGPFLHGGAAEYQEAPGVFVPVVSLDIDDEGYVDLTAFDLQMHARHTETAAAWLHARQAEVSS